MSLDAVRLRGDVRIRPDRQGFVLSQKILAKEHLSREKIPLFVVC